MVFLPFCQIGLLESATIVVNYCSSVLKSGILRIRLGRICVNIIGGIGCCKALQHDAKSIALGGECAGGVRQRVPFEQAMDLPTYLRFFDVT